MAFDKMQRKRNKMRVRDCIRIGEGIFFPTVMQLYKADLVASNFFFIYQQLIILSTNKTGKEISEKLNDEGKKNSGQSSKNVFFILSFSL